MLLPDIDVTDGTSYYTCQFGVVGVELLYYVSMFIFWPDLSVMCASDASV